MQKDRLRLRRRRGLLTLLLVGLVTASGCGPAGQDRTPAALTLEALKNAAYSGVFEEQVRLTDGEYEGERFVEGGASRPTLTLLDVHALGDLDGDGADDAAVVLVQSAGGSGSFRYLAVVLNREGSPENVATQLIGDREQVESVAIDGTQITVEALVHGPDDPACCPTQPVTLTYQFFGEQLSRVGEEVAQEAATEEPASAAAPVFETTAVSLSGTQWTLVSLVDDQGETVPAIEGSAVTAEFSDDRVFGNAGCNDYGASYDSGGGALTVAPVGVTRQVCAEPAGVMEQELAFLGALVGAAGYRVDGDALMLLDVEGAPLATFAVAGPGTIVGVIWQWIGLVDTDPTMESVVPDPDRPAIDPDPELYTLVLDADGTYEAQADCHQVGGEYLLAGGSLTLGVEPVALADCGPESLFDIYLTSLFSVESAGMEQGRLVLQVAGNSQKMVFRSAGLAEEASD